MSIDRKDICQNHDYAEVETVATLNSHDRRRIIELVRMLLASVQFNLTFEAGLREM